jgi:hypothetical protein
MFFILNFLVEILLILTYDLGSTDQAMNDSPFHMMWMVRLGRLGHEEASQTDHESITETHSYMRYVHFNSNHPQHVKRGVVHSLISRAKVICQDQKNVNKETNNIKHYLILN